MVGDASICIHAHRRGWFVRGRSVLKHRAVPLVYLSSAQNVSRIILPGVF